jgi:hypothetical protein
MTAARVLHITNSDAAVQAVRRARMVGEFLAWKDPLYEGPIRSDLPLERHSAMRASYLSARGLRHPIRALHEFARRDAIVAKARDFEEIILWFEHDLFDQLQLVQILVVLAAMRLEPGRVTLVQADDFLTQLVPDDLAARGTRRRSVTEGAFSAARRVWEALGASEPHALSDAARVEHPGLPYLRPALARLCEEYPSVRDALSRTQRNALETVERNPGLPSDELFRRAQAREEVPFLGDGVFEAVLRDLAAEPGALIEPVGAGFTTTALGRRILGGDADWAEIRPIERFVGGVHLRPGRLWRYDEQTRSFVLSDGQR